MNQACRVEQETNQYYDELEVAADNASAVMKESLDTFVRNAFDNDNSEESSSMDDLLLEGKSQTIELLLNDFPLDVTPTNYKQRLSVRQQEVFMQDALALYCKLNNAIIDSL